MTIVVSITIPEGIVFAADSRQTYTNSHGDVRVSSDNAVKLFQLNDRIAAATYGWAFMDGRNILSHVKDFKVQLKDANISVSEMARRLGEYLTEIYQRGTNNKVDTPVEDGNYAVGLLVGGYDPGGAQGQVYELYIPKGESVLRRTSDESPGSAWRGHTPVISRLLRGFDPRIEELDGYNEPLAKQLDEGKLSFQIDYWTMTAQDAVDFALFLVHTTTQMQRFSDGIGLYPGASSNCGGPIDIAFIEPVKGLEWVQSKRLHASRAGEIVWNGET